MDYKYIEQLLERYWQCETSREEECILRAFFSQKDVPSELQQYRDLFAYEQQTLEEETLSDDFDERIMSMIEEPRKVKAKKVKLTTMLMPLARAAAVVAIVLTLGNAISSSLDNGNRAETSSELTAFEGTCDTIQLLSGTDAAHKIDSMMAAPANGEIDSMMKKVFSEHSVRY